MLTGFGLLQFKDGSEKAFCGEEFNPSRSELNALRGIGEDQLGSEAIFVVVDENGNDKPLHNITEVKVFMIEQHQKQLEDIDLEKDNKASVALMYHVRDDSNDDKPKPWHN